MSNYPAFTQLPAGCGFSTVFPNMDFETYSEAGYVFNRNSNKWETICELPAKGGTLAAVGIAVYSEHPSTEVLSLSYDLKDGIGPSLWLPGQELPYRLFNYIRSSGIIEAHNSSFEWHMWENVCHKRMYWPELPYVQLRDSAAKARAFSLPSALSDIGKILDITDKKFSEGPRLIKKFSVPHNPTQKNPATRIHPSGDPVDGPLFYEYNLQDVRAESEISERLSDLSSVELDTWLLDQKINFHGVKIDESALDDCIEIMNQTFKPLEKELFDITGGAVENANQFQRMAKWLTENGVPTDSVNEETTLKLLSDTDIQGPCRRVLELRQILSFSSVKKAFSIKMKLNSRGRLEDLFAYYGARTGRAAGRGPQPQNLPNSGPKIKKCSCGCEHYYLHSLEFCPWCGMASFLNDDSEWCFDAVGDALFILATRNVSIVNYFFGDSLALISGCLRALFVPSPGYDFICSDYSAIEAVVLAELARESWRQEVFRTHGKIYEMSASRITGIPFEEFIRHKQETGEHHPLRKKVGKVAELASGYQGWIGAWKRFGAEEFFKNDDEIKQAILKWRNDSPCITAFWKGVENAAIHAIQNPGECYLYNWIAYGVKNKVLYCRLLSGRMLQYHEPELRREITEWGKERTVISFMGWNTDREKGPYGWIRLDTWGGKLTENIVQATARDILTHAMLNLDRAGYKIVLHIHDEICAEIPEGVGSVEQFEQIMTDLPEWCRDWPIRATGGWRGKRYRKG